MFVGLLESALTVTSLDMLSFIVVSYPVDLLPEIPSQETKYEILSALSESSEISLNPFSLELLRKSKVIFQNVWLSEFVES